MKFLHLFFTVVLFSTNINGQADISDENQQIHVRHDNCEESSRYYSRGEQYDGEEKYDLSIAEYTKSINCDTLFLKAYFARGTAKINDSQYGTAIEDFNKVLELEPDYATAYFYRAFAKWNQYRWSEKNSNPLQKAGFETKTYLTPPSRVYHGRSLTTAEKEDVCSDYETGRQLSSEKTELFKILQTFCEKNEPDALKN